MGRQLNLKVWVAEIPNSRTEATHYAKIFPLSDSGKTYRLYGCDEFYGTGKSEEEALKDSIHSLFMAMNKENDIGCSCGNCWICSGGSL